MASSFPFCFKFWGGPGGPGKNVWSLPSGARGWGETPPPPPEKPQRAPAAPPRGGSPSPNAELRGGGAGLLGCHAGSAGGPGVSAGEKISHKSLTSFFGPPRGGGATSGPLAGSGDSGESAGPWPAPREASEKPRQTGGGRGASKQRPVPRGAAPVNEYIIN